MTWFRKKSDEEETLLGAGAETTDKQKLAIIEKEIKECKEKIDALTVTPIEKLKEEIKFKKQMYEKALASYDSKSTQVNEAKNLYEAAQKKLEMESKQCMANLEKSGLLKTMENLQLERDKIKGISSYKPPR